MSLMLALTTCHPPIMFIAAVAKCIDSFSMAPCKAHRTYIRPPKTLPILIASKVNKYVA